MEGLSAPGAVDLRSKDLASEWRRWSRAFEDYLLAINVVDGTAPVEKRKLALFRHIGGEDVREVYSQMEFKAADGTTDIAEGEVGRKLQDVLKKFREYCNPRSGIVVSRYEFHGCSQNGETVDVYLMKLRRLAESCDFEGQRDSLIRDKLLFGLDDEKTKEKLMRESDEKLTLDYVIKSVRVAEAAKLTLGRPVEKLSSEVSAVSISSRGYQKDAEFRKSKIKCGKCGKEHFMNKCPAFGSKCHKCKKKNHWANVCQNEVSELNDENDEEELYFGEVVNVDSVETGSWFSVVRVSTEEKLGQPVKFKLDTGAALSVCGPKHCIGLVKPTSKKLFGPGHTPLCCLGVISSRISAGDRSMMEDIYVVDNQATPLLSRRACEGLQLVTVNKDQCQVESVTFAVDRKLFQGLGKVDREYAITLKDDPQPFAINVPRPIPFPLRERAKIAIEDMVRQGVIVAIDEPTPWVAPMVVVPKPGQEKVRICTDYTELNKHVMREVHPMATVESSLASIGNGKIFSKIDANSGFWQIPLSVESSKLTTFLTHQGRYRYLRLPQGLCSAPEIFQAEMSRILKGAEGVVIHMDDILVYGQDKPQHDMRLKVVLSKILEAGLTLNESKCRFGVERVCFLGYVIDEKGIHAGPRVQGILDFPAPTDVKSVRSFLGLVNQYARFSSRIAEVSKPIRDLLQKDVVWTWEDAQKEAFRRMKLLFEEPPVLANYDVRRETIVSTDASNYGLGATLSQVQEDGTRRLVAAASRSLTETEQRYAAIEKEALGVCWAMEKFAHYILGMASVTIETDHKPLISLFGNRFLDRLPPRIQSFKLRLQRFQYAIRHINGTRNQSADALSRFPTSTAEQIDELRAEEASAFVEEAVWLNGLDRRLEEMKVAQQGDEILQKVIEFVRLGWPSYLSSVDSALRPYYDRKHLLVMNKGFLMLGSRIVVPVAERYRVLMDIHKGHLGITKCQSRARNSVWWPAISKAIEDMVGQCLICKMEANKVVEPLRPTATPTRPWQVVGSDLFHFKGSVYLLVVDYYSRYPEVALIDGEVSARNMITRMKSMFSRHGIPEAVISDNGGQYDAREFSSFASEYGFTHITSSPRYPRGNGAAERTVQTVKRLLKKEPDPYLAMLAYRSSPHLGGYSPAELLMGRKLRTTVVSHPDVLDPKLPDHDVFRAKNDVYKERMKANHDDAHKTRALRPVTEGTRVFVRDTRDHGVALTESDGASRTAVIRTDGGSRVRRNRSAIIPVAEEPEDKPVTTTRSGRVVKTPGYLAAYDCAK